MRISVHLEPNEDVPQHRIKGKCSIINNKKNNINKNANTTEPLITVEKSLIPSSTDQSSTIERDLWTNKVEFLLSVIGYVVDLGKKKTQ